MDVTGTEPAVLPNLYYGSPVKLYGRYKGGGTAEVTLRGSINGVEMKQAAQLDFPKSDDANPEVIPTDHLARGAFVPSHESTGEESSLKK